VNAHQDVSGTLTRVSADSAHDPREVSIYWLPAQVTVARFRPVASQPTGSPILTQHEQKGCHFAERSHVGDSQLAMVCTATVNYAARFNDNFV
jgi:hypothetical protein